MDSSHPCCMTHLWVQHHGEHLGYSLKAHSASLLSRLCHTFSHNYILTPSLHLHSFFPPLCSIFRVSPFLPKGLWVIVQHSKAAQRRHWSSYSGVQLKCTAQQAGYGNNQHPRQFLVCWFVQWSFLRQAEVCDAVECQNSWRDVNDLNTCNTPHRLVNPTLLSLHLF